MKLALFRTIVFLAMTCGPASATIAHNPAPPKRFGVVIRSDRIEYRPSCKGTQPFEHCKVYTSLPPAHPQLLKRHGIIYGVRNFGYQRGCKGTPRDDACKVYNVSGSIVSVWREPDTHRTTGFMLRMPNGRTQEQNLDVTYFPVAADHLIRPGRRVRVAGSMSGQGQVAAPDEIIVEARR